MISPVWPTLRGTRHSPESGAGTGGELLLWAILAILIVLWLLGLALDIVGAFIHVLLIVAAIVLVIELARRARAT